jgi:hypothetical protein
MLSQYVDLLHDYAIEGPFTTAIGGEKPPLVPAGTARQAACEQDLKVALASKMNPMLDACRISV